MKKVYYVSDEKLMCMTLDDLKSFDMEIDSFKKINNIYDYMYKDGKEYLFLNAVATNNQPFKIMIDAATKDIAYLFAKNDCWFQFENKHLTMTNYMDDSNSIFYDFVNDNIGYQYTATEPDGVNNIRILSDQRVLFTMILNGKASIFLFDHDKLVASTVFNIADHLISSDTYDDQEEFSEIYLYNDSFELPNGDIVFCAQTNDYGYYFKWTPQTQNITNNAADIYKFSIDEFVSAHTEEDISKYLPGKLDDELQPLRLKADDLEKKYSVDIEIGEEASGIYPSYLATDMCDYDTVKRALDQLDEQLGRYPEGFFKQFKNEQYDGLTIALAASLSNLSSDYISGIAGVTISNNGTLTIIYDISDSDGLISTINHEMCHAIENIIEARWLMEGNDEDDYCLSYEKWNQFNPKVDDSIYTNDYQTFIPDEYEKYCNELMGYENLYFVLEYGMTYPKEDRATIFEQVMTNHFSVDLDQAPHIIEKLNYYCKGIRENFDTTGWDNVPWEKYYKAD